MRYLHQLEVDGQSLSATEIELYVYGEAECRGRGITLVRDHRGVKVPPLRWMPKRDEKALVHPKG